MQYQFTCLATRLLAKLINIYEVLLSISANLCLVPYTFIQHNSQWISHFTQLHCSADTKNFLKSPPTHNSVLLSLLISCSFFVKL